MDPWSFFHSLSDLQKVPNDKNLLKIGGRFCFFLCLTDIPPHHNSYNPKTLLGDKILIPNTISRPMEAYA
jgi:hypothetical protein